MQKKILIVHLNSNGDILLATPIARQIKEIDYAGCHLTWAVGSYYKTILKNNPYIDEIIEVPLENAKDYVGIWNNFYKKTIEFKKQGLFDLIFYTQAIGDTKFSTYNGSLRNLILKSYPNKIIVPLNPVVKLSSLEIDNVNLFVQKNNLLKYKVKILFECSPQSGQLHFTPEIAVKIASDLVFQNNVCFIISSSQSIKADYSHIIDGSVLTLRENAELTKHCDLLIGCSSGISWISRSTWAKRLPMIQLMNPETLIFNSFILDHKKFNLDFSDILELYNPSETEIIQCVLDYINIGIGQTIIKHQVKTKPSFSFFKYFFNYFIDGNKYKHLLRLIYYHYKIYFYSVTFNLVFLYAFFEGLRSKIRIRTRIKTIFKK